MTATDIDIAQALLDRRLTPAMVGLARVEVRYFASHPSDDDTRCDLVSVLFDEDGWRLGTFLHCEDAYSDEPGPDIEGIGAEYDNGTTVSYLSDDPELLTAITALLDSSANLGGSTS